MRNPKWYKGSLGERLVLRWRTRRTGAPPVLDILGELRLAKKILILPNDRVGGLFIGAPTYELIRRVYPRAEIVLLADRRKVSLARQLPFVDRVISAGLDKPSWSSGHRKLVLELQAEAFDVALCLGPDCSFRLAQLCAQSGARLRIGFQREGLYPEFNIQIERRFTEIYENEQYLNMLQLLGFTQSYQSSWTMAPEKGEQIRRRYLEEEGSKRVVALDLAGGEASGLTKGQLHQLVGRIVERRARAMIFFSLAQKKQVDYLKRAYSSRVLVFEQNDLAVVAALLEACQVLIACNTDLLHLAVLLKIPVVGIFDESPKRWIELPNPLVTVIQTPRIKTLGVSQISESLEMALNQRRGVKVPTLS